MKRNHIMKQCFFLGVVGALTVLGGCSADGIEMPEDAYFLCSAGWNYEPGVKLLNSQGEVVLQVNNACIKHCVDAEGNILYQSAGVIAQDTVLFIDIDESPDDNIIDTGIWDVAEEKWIMEPGNGVALTATKDDVLDSFVIGNQQYGADYKPMERYPEMTFSFADGMVLKNKLGRDYRNYICDQYENEYLRIGDFLRINRDSGIDFPKAQEITIEDAILGKYMVVGVSVWELRSDGTELGTQRKYLCDMEGKILFPELKYETIFYPEDQYFNSSRQYIQIYIDENTPSQLVQFAKMGSAYM